MSAPFDATRARRHRQRTRDHPAYILADPDRPRGPHTCAGCGDPVRWVRSVPVTWGAAGLRYILGGPPAYHRRGHWRHYPEPPRVLCDCGHDPDDHDMRAAPPRCQHAGCACGEEATL